MTDLVTGSAGPRFLDHNVLELVRIRERLPETLGRLGLPFAKHVSVVLRVGIESRGGDADVAPEDIARLDHGILAEFIARALRCTATLGWNQVSSPSR